MILWGVPIDQSRRNRLSTAWHLRHLAKHIRCRFADAGLWRGVCVALAIEIIAVALVGIVWWIAETV